MNININNLVSISEANQNCSKIVRMVDENGAAVISNFFYRSKKNK